MDGISLTIVELTDNFLSVYLIPTTIEDTCLGDRKVGDLVNIETDVIGKYVQRLLTVQQYKSSNITMSSFTRSRLVNFLTVEIFYLDLLGKKITGLP